MIVFGRRKKGTPTNSRVPLRGTARCLTTQSERAAGGSRSDLAVDFFLRGLRPFLFFPHASTEDGAGLKGSL